MMANKYYRITKIIYEHFVTNCVIKIFSFIPEFHKDIPIHTYKTYQIHLNLNYHDVF